MIDINKKDRFVLFYLKLYLFMNRIRQNCPYYAHLFNILKIAGINLIGQCFYNKYKRTMTKMNACTFLKA